MDPQDYFRGLASPMKEIAIELRRLVKALPVELKEEIKWGVPTYSLKRNVCSIIAHSKHVNLQIMRGAHIKNVEGLHGSGKDMRHLKFAALQGVEPDKIRDCLTKAIQLDK